MQKGDHWWRETTIYQIYPRSFADSNGDGIGDLRGIISRLDYVEDLGFETIWLSPPYASPQRDFGYDISDHCAIAPEYGTLADAQELIDQAHRRGMKIIFDLILNHTSDQHPWFLESRSSRQNPRREWYIWRDGRGKRPPTNWLAIPGGSGWEYDPMTDQWYFHNFLPFQPDLNFRNPDAKAAMFDVMRFWLERGVDGFRLDIFHAIYKDEQFRDNPFSWRFVPSGDHDEGLFQKAVYNLNRPEGFELAREVRSLIDSYQPARFVVGEVFGRGVVKEYLGKKGEGLNLILLFDLMEMKLIRASEVRDLLLAYESEYPLPALPTYALGNHDRRRYLSRIGKDPGLAKLLAFLVLTVRGVPLNYYGDELGIPDGDFPHRNARDSVAQAYWWLPRWLAGLLGLYINRDGCRTPMQWDDSPQAGFTTPDAVPWLPVHPGYASCNVESQREDPASLLRTYQELLHLRRRFPSLRAGALELLPAGILPEDVLGYDRVFGSERIRILLNFGSRKRMLNDPEGFAELLLGSGPDCQVGPDGIALGPWGAVILR